MTKRVVMKVYRSAFLEPGSSGSIDDIVRRMAKLGVTDVASPVYDGSTAYFGGSPLPKTDTEFDIAAVREAVRKAGMRFIAVCRIFYDPDAVKADPSLAPIGSDGKPYKVDGWYVPVCPTAGRYRGQRLRTLESAVKALKPDAVALDFIRYPLFWEQVRPGTKREDMVEYCFCPRCLDRFGRDTGITVPKDQQAAEWILANHRDEWTAWKCRVIAGFADEAALCIRRSAPSTEVWAHVLPWTNDEYSGAMREIAGQDLKLMANELDVLSPMAYHRILGRKPEWVAGIAPYAHSLTGKPIVVSVQSMDGNDPLPFDQMAVVVHGALKSPSAGVSIFHWELFRPVDAQDMERKKELLWE